ncbi:MAG: glutamate synthase [Nitrospirae bacterium]|nr:glutamate synthase [Nitrospirota bacterium]
MCRLSAITSSDYFSPMENIIALETMKEGHDGSGLGLVFKDLGGVFADYKQYPILSAICTDIGLDTLNNYMAAIGFKEIFSWQPKIRKVSGVIERGLYITKIYDYPDKYKDQPFNIKEDLLMNTRIKLRTLGESDQSMFVFSFYPDIITLKEVGDPLDVSEFFSLDNGELIAKIILAQGRQNTNYEIYLYACHPFFLQGYSTMTNGENTAFVPIREFLSSRDFPGYMGYNSDSEVFTHILHYSNRHLKYPLTYYKDIITPLRDNELSDRSDKDALRMIKNSLRPLCIDGPNCVIGFTPDGTTFMVHDSKKLRPGVVGGIKGKYAFMSEECGLQSAIPVRNLKEDIIPMKYDMVIVPPGAEEVRKWSQLHGK